MNQDVTKTEKIVFRGQGPWKIFLEMLDIKSINLSDIEKEKPNVILTTESTKQETKQYLKKLKLNREVIMYTLPEKSYDFKQDEDIHNLISQALGIKI